MSCSEAFASGRIELFFEPYGRLLCGEQFRWFGPMRLVFGLVMGIFSRVEHMVLGEGFLVGRYKKRPTAEDRSYFVLLSGNYLVSG